MTEHNFGPLVAHAPYTLNPCSDKPHAREFALECMADDLPRQSHDIPVDWVVTPQGARRL